jgi:hypothetical protein
MAMRWLPRPPTKKISAKCAAAHFAYLKVATSTVCATTSPFDLLPHPAPVPSPPPAPDYF